MNYDLPNMEVGQWNLSLQRQISNTVCNMQRVRQRPITMLAGGSI